MLTHVENTASLRNTIDAESEYTDINLKSYNISFKNRINAQIVLQFIM